MRRRSGRKLSYCITLLFLLVYPCIYLQARSDYAVLYLLWIGAGCVDLMKKQAEYSLQAKHSRASFSTVFILGSTLLGLIAFFIRIFYTVDFYDEFFNTAVAYQPVLGQTFLSDIWNFYQTGDSIQIPFLWLFRIVFGSTEGVILAGRIYYFLCCCIIGGIVFLTFQEDRNIAMIAAAITVCYAPFSLSYWWYDTVMIQFLLLGCLFLLRALDTEKASRERANFIAAGLCHAWMVFSYPFTVIIVIFFAVFLALRKRSFKATMWYLLGALILFGVFCTYGVGIGLKNIFFFRQNQSSVSIDMVPPGLSDRGYMFNVEGYFTRISSSVIAAARFCWKQLAALIVSAGFILCFYRRGRWKLCLSVLLLQPFLPFLLSLTANDFSTIFYWSYFFALNFFCWLILRSTNERRKSDTMFYVLWLPSILAFCAITLTSVGEINIKGLLGLYCGGLCGFLSLLFTIRVVLKKLSISASKLIISCSALAILACEVLLYWANPYRSERAFRCNYVMQSGVCKGIITVPADLSFETLEKELNSLIVQRDRTILSLDRAAYLYLMTDLIMATPTPDAWMEDYMYWEQVTGKPDIILCLPDRLNEKSETIRNILEKEYTLIGTAGDFSVYRIVEPDEVPAVIRSKAMPDHVHIAQ